MDSAISVLVVKSHNRIFSVVYHIIICIFFLQSNVTLRNSLLQSF